jgi:hypothetical protein
MNNHPSREVVYACTHALALADGFEVEVTKTA